MVQGQLFFDVEYVKLQDEIRDVDRKTASLSTAKQRAMGVFESVQDGIDATQAAADQFSNVTDVILPLLENMAMFDSLMSRITQVRVCKNEADSKLIDATDPSIRRSSLDTDLWSLQSAYCRLVARWSLPLPHNLSLHRYIALR